jgi:hypothetical protein
VLQPQYALDITNTETNAFRVLTAAANEVRRNVLFLESLKLQSYTMLLVAALTPDTILQAV